MSKQVMNLQDYFLNVIRRENIGVTIFLVNGFQIKGSVKGFDSFTVVVETEGKTELIYKHAISTIVPARNIPFSFDEA
ncbi:MAG: RNA chaperone Hfq [Firmicutes bacterium]|nr:RNA chaperone Hfq [Bacillota bacterium]